MNDDFEFMLSTSQAVAIRKIDDSDEKIKQLVVRNYGSALKKISGSIGQFRKRSRLRSNLLISNLVFLGFQLPLYWPE